MEAWKAGRTSLEVQTVWERVSEGRESRCGRANARARGPQRLGARKRVRMKPRKAGRTSLEVQAVGGAGSW